MGCGAMGCVDCKHPMLAIHTSPALRTAVRLPGPSVAAEKYRHLSGSGAPVSENLPIGESDRRQAVDDGSQVASGVPVPSAYVVVPSAAVEFHHDPLIGIEHVPPDDLVTCPSTHLPPSGRQSVRTRCDEPTALQNRVRAHLDIGNQ